MRCFYHGEVEAVAICKSCLRGLCRECCVEVGHTSACRNRCEPEVETLNALLERNKKAYRTTSATYYRNGIFMLVIGTIFAGFGAFTITRHEPNYFLLILGVLFLFYGVSQFSAARRWNEK